MEMNYEDDTICYVGGTFDLLHIGHLNLLKKCRGRFDRVCVGLNTDEFNLRYKGRLPIFPLKDRIVMVRALRDVDRVYVNVGCEDSRLAIIKSRAGFIVHGDDWAEDDLMRQMGLTKDWMESNNIKFYFFPHTPNISTTKIIGQAYEPLHIGGSRPIDATMVGKSAANFNLIDSPSSSGDQSLGEHTRSNG